MDDHQTLTDSELVILSLILEQPMHGYQIEQTIDARNMRAWTDLATSSIYYLLQRLELKGFLQELPTKQGGRGKPRKVYCITAEGERIWRNETIRALARPRVTYTTFLMGLHNLWHIQPGDAADAVRSYRTWLAADLQRQREEFARFEEKFFPLDVLFEYGFVLGDAELGFLDDLIHLLETRAQGG